MNNSNPIGRNHPYLEKAVVALWYAEDACADFLEDHEDEAQPYACDCLLCEDVQGILFNVRNAEAMITSQLRSMPPKLRQLRARGFPDADSFAQMVLSLGRGGDADDCGIVE